jgi:hypothetical protein
MSETNKQTKEERKKERKKERKDGRNKEREEIYTRKNDINRKKTDMNR